MASDNGLQSKILEISQHIDELKKQGLDNPEKVMKALTSALDELEVSLEELSAANEEIIQQNEELVKAHEALRESDVKYRTIADNTYDWEIWLDPGGSFLYCSPSCERITGYRADEFIADSGLLRTILHPDDRAIFEDHFCEVRRDSSHKQEMELRIVRPDGTMRWIGHACQPVFDDEGCFLGARGSNRDITERKQAEEALRKAKVNLEIHVKERTAELELVLAQLKEEINEREAAEKAVKAERQRFIDVLETLPAYLVLLTPDYHVPFANRFFRERFGESHGRRCFEYLFGRTEPCEICETYSVLKTNKPHHWEWTGPDDRNYDIFDFPFTDSDGSTLIMETGIDITERKRAEIELKKYREHLEELVLDRTRELEAANAELHVEIAERKRAEAALKEGEQRFRDAVDNFPNVFVIYGPDRRIQFINSIGLEITGHREADVIGLRDEEIFPPEIINSYVPALKRAVGTKMPQTLERTRVASMGGQTVVINVIPLLDKRGEIRRILGITYDITERKLAEEEIKKLNQDLQNRAAALEAANKELESFSYSVSHDLRSPLRAMDGFSRILQEDYSAQLPPEAQRYLQLVRSSAQQMGRLIDDLLAFSRLGRQSLNKQYVLPIDLVNNVLDELKSEFTGRRVDIVISDLPACEADPILLKQVFVNFISNALKFTRKREAARVEVGSQTMNGKVVYFIKDNGAGFDMQYMHKLFGVFQRLHSTDEYEGNGVGLANVQRIIHRHGGTVWAEGEVDKGATFYFTLNGGI
jgi:PAS domain S-box-containing protein